MLNELEKLVRDTLGPVQVEIRSKVVSKEAITKPIVAGKARVKPAKVEEFIPVTPKEIPIHLKQGKVHFGTSHYQEALKEFQSILAIAPGNIEARVWIRKTNEALTKPKAEPVAEGEATFITEEVKPKECLWMRMGMVGYRFCTRNYDCLTCEFDQMMQEKMASGEAPELEEALARFKGFLATKDFAAMLSRVISLTDFVLVSSSVSPVSSVK